MALPPAARRLFRPWSLAFFAPVLLLAACGDTRPIVPNHGLGGGGGATTGTGGATTGTGGTTPGDAGVEGG